MTSRSTRVRPSAAAVHGLEWLGGHIRFLRVISTTDLISATISNQFNGGYISDEGFDNFRLAAAAVPEPASLVMIGVGLAFADAMPGPGEAAGRILNISDNR